VAKLVWNPRWHNPHLGKWLHRIACPTQIVWGRQDRFVPPPYATALAAAIPGATVEWIDACGHVPQLDRPAELERRLADFIARVAP
jgi:pimeloyl-ACP methyl ester carboxylesterase